MGGKWCWSSRPETAWRIRACASPGTQAAINRALNGLQFQPTANYSGTASLKLTTNYLGNIGAGGPQSDTDMVDLTIPPGSASFLAASTPKTALVAESALTADALAPIVAEALKRRGSSLASTGTTMALDKVEFKIADLPGALLGQASGNTIVIDADAAGYGWFIDRTPANNQEFSRRTLNGELFATPLSLAFGEMDLLTVVTHELGHVLGLTHSPQGVMEPTLQAGERLSQAYSDIGAAPTRRTAAPVNKAAVHTWVFDELRGELSGAGMQHSAANLK